jgi:hypothetical protein
MVDSTELNQPDSNNQPNWLEVTGKNRQQVGALLMVAGLLLGVIPLTLAIKYRQDLLWITIPTIFPAVTTLLCGLGARFWPVGEVSERDAGRMIVLAVGGLLGFGVLLVSFGTAIQWWEVVGGGLQAWQGSGGWKLWIVIMLQIVGLALMFASLQLARLDERSSPTLRRLLYGYNAALAGLLLLEILGILNIVGYAFLPASDDWTSKSINALSSKSENIVAGLNKPTKVYVFFGGGRDDFQTKRNLEALLDNCRAINDKITVEYISPDLEQEKASDLAQKYKLTDREGVLITYGTEPNIEHQFIKIQALYTGSEPMMPGAPQQNRRLFKGESEIMTALNYLSEGKQKPVIYFTQGNGELDLADSSSRAPDQGAGALKRLLEAGNLTVKGLEFSPVEGRQSKQLGRVIATSVPKDAALVVIAGPKQSLPEYAIKALRDYMNPPAGDGSAPKGRLLVFFDVVPPSEGVQTEQTGLKELLAEYNVEVGENRILQVGGPRGAGPIAVAAITNPSDFFLAHNPIAAAFKRRLFVLFDVRTVTPKIQNRPQSANYQAETLIYVLEENNAWAETDLRTDPLKIVSNLRKPERRAELQKKISEEPISVAVCVTEQPPMTNPHAMPQADEGKPRLIVCGNANMASNWGVSEENRYRTYDLVQSMISWLRERPASIGIEAKRPDIYDVDAASVSKSRMVLVPAALIFVSIIGLGTGVWVVRRR